MQPFPSQKNSNPSESRLSDGLPKHAHELGLRCMCDPAIKFIVLQMMTDNEPLDFESYERSFAQFFQDFQMKELHSIGFLFENEVVQSFLKNMNYKDLEHFRQTTRFMSHLSELYRSVDRLHEKIQGKVSDGKKPDSMTDDEYLLMIKAFTVHAAREHNIVHVT